MGRTLCGQQASTREREVAGMLLLKGLGVTLGVFVAVAGVAWGVVAVIRWVRRHRSAAAGGAAGLIADSSRMPVATGGFGEKLGEWLDSLAESGGASCGGGSYGDDGGFDGGDGDGD